MAQHAVYRLPDGGLVVDWQSDFLSTLRTRLAVPLVDPDTVPGPLSRLHPIFEVDGNRLLLTHLAGAVDTADLGHP